MNTNKYGWKNKKKSVSFCVYLWLIFPVLFFAACNQLEKPKTEPFYAQTAPPQKKEFRWSNGKMPKSFDPALAAAPPETDVVRAVFDGLTDTDPKTLQAVAAVAEKWESSKDFKTWTFHLRRSAKWSNGERVTAQDFASSWKRLSEMGEKVSHSELFANVVGMRFQKKGADSENQELDIVAKPSITENLPLFSNQTNANSSTLTPPKNESEPTENENKAAAEPKTNQKTKEKEKQSKPRFGVEAIDNYTLKVSLVKPDKDFPALAAHPIFRPVYGDGKAFEKGKLNADIVTNGAFRIFSVGQDGITLDRAEHYWNAAHVELERVRFVPTENAEKALEAYRAGEIDALTNADFEPLALKLLMPFDDFRRTAHGALNFYEFNLTRKPFDDRRVREALAIAIERERLTEGEMEGTSRPALSFLPFGEAAGAAKLVQDAIRAQNLLAEAGFPEGADFPAVKLFVNRNNIQQRIARSVAKMWKQTLNIETEIVVKEPIELETAKQTDDFDVIRRGVVLPTTNEAANMSVIFAPDDKTEKNSDAELTAKEKSGETGGEIIDSDLSNENANVSEKPVTELPKSAVSINENSDSETSKNIKENEPILTEQQAITELRAIPLYFPTSYSLVKPYILGFEINSLDAPSLKDVKIDNDWQPKAANDKSQLF